MPSISSIPIHPPLPSLVPSPLSNPFSHGGPLSEIDIPFEALISSNLRASVTSRVLADVRILPRILADTKIQVNIPAAIWILVRFTPSIMVSPNVKTFQ